MPILFIAVGLVYVLFPRLAWNTEIKWKSAKKEPTRKALMVNRIIGIILLLMGIYYMMK